ncbi:MAG: hypothetical protein HY812_05995 [Planctomycetes bacterium]|nr:hypothetical protein [Planctomycetota bacterium]
MISGDLEALRWLLAADPALVHARSRKSHGATLLHYVAGNGIEPERETVPENAVEVARLPPRRFSTTARSASATPRSRSCSPGAARAWTT